MSGVIICFILALYIPGYSGQGFVISPYNAPQYKPRILQKTCYLIPEPGPCRANLTMYYFDPNTKKCDTFYWGGCQGNGNRYDSAEECYYYCLSSPGSRKPLPRSCYLAFDYGYCFGAEMRWYYDKIWKVCKHTIFSGCGGNRNNFPSRKKCIRTCRHHSGGGGGGGGGSGGSGGSGSGVVNDVVHEIIMNPSGITPTTTCFKPRHTTTTTTTSTTEPNFPTGTDPSPPPLY